jgi:hypothetical protein
MRHKATDQRERSWRMAAPVASIDRAIRTRSPPDRNGRASGYAECMAALRILGWVWLAGAAVPLSSLIVALAGLAWLAALGEDEDRSRSPLQETFST